MPVGCLRNAVARLFGSSSQPDQVEAQNSVPPPLPQAPPAPTVSPEQAMLDEIKRFRGAVQGEAARMRLEEQAALVDAKRKVEKATEFVRKADLDGALCELLQEVYHWASWSKRDDWATLSNRNLQNVECVGGGDGQGERNSRKTIELEADGQRYTLTLNISPSYGEGDPLGELSLTVDGDTVFVVDVSQDISADYDRWRPFRVSVLKHGDWIARLVEWQEIIRTNRDLKYRQFHNDALRKQAEGLPD
jgi:hypothetical protein